MTVSRKKSKVWRKELNDLRAMGEVPWPARRFKIAPTTGRPLQTTRHCTKLVGQRWRRRRGWRGVIDLLRRRRPVHDVAMCNQPLELVPFDGRRRGHLRCPRCSPIRRMKKQVADELRRSRRR